MTAQTLPSTGINLRAGAIDLPLESVDVAATVDGRGVTWTVTQTFTNTMTDAAEAVYTFPLPNEGAVAGVTMRIGDRTITADIKPRDEARIEYEEAVASGHTASLLEQEAGEIFTMSVGNIHPGETISVVITVHDTVLLEDDEASVRMPTLVKTRYVPADVPIAGEVSPPRHHGEVHVNSTVRIAFAEPVADPVCDTIPGATVLPDSVAVDGFSLDRDIVVRWRVPAAIAEAKWVADPDDPAMGTIEVDIRTAPDATVGRRRRVLQVTVDRSGSMGGDAMTMAIRVASDAIGSLSADDYVHVLVFDTTIEALDGCAAGPVPATAANKARLLRELAGVDARGGTALDGAIEAAGAALALADDLEGSGELDRIALLITDGAYGDEATAARQRDVHLRSARVIVVGIGQDLNGYLRTLTANGAFLALSTPHRMADVSRQVCGRVGAAPRRAARIDADGLSEQAPHLAPDLYPGGTITLWARASRPATGATVTVACDDGVVATLPIRIAQDASAASRWAKARINAVNYDVMVGTVDATAGEAAIVALSTRFRVLSTYTAWIAVDRSRTTDTIIPVRAHQPVLGLHKHVMRLRYSRALPDIDYLAIGSIDGPANDLRVTINDVAPRPSRWDGAFESFEASGPDEPDFGSAARGAPDSTMGPLPRAARRVLATITEVLREALDDMNVRPSNLGLMEALERLDNWIEANSSHLVDEAGELLREQLDELRMMLEADAAQPHALDRLVAICIHLADD